MRYIVILFALVSIVPLASCDGGSTGAGEPNPDDNFEISIDASYAAQFTEEEEAYLELRLDRAIRPLNAIADLFPPDKFTTVKIRIMGSCPRTIDNANISTDTETGETTISLCGSVREALISTLYTTGLDHRVRDNINTGDNAFVTYIYHYVGHYLFDTYSIFEKFGTETDSEEEMREAFADQFTVYTSLQDFGGDRQVYFYGHTHARAGINGSSFETHLNGLPGVDLCLLHGGAPWLQESSVLDSYYRGYGLPTASESALAQEQQQSAEYESCKEEGEETIQMLVDQAPRIHNTPFNIFSIETEEEAFIEYDIGYFDVDLAMNEVPEWRKPLAPVPDWPEITWRDTVYDLESYTGFVYKVYFAYNFAYISILEGKIVSVAPQSGGFECKATPEVSTLERASGKNSWSLRNPIKMDCYINSITESGELEPQLLSRTWLNSIELPTHYPEIEITGPDDQLDGSSYSPEGFWCEGGRPCWKL